MNSHTFLEYSQNHKLLSRVTYQELKSLVVQFPYCQILRLLLLKKGIMDDNNDYNKNLSMASVYSLNRASLFMEIKANENIAQNYRKEPKKETQIIFFETPNKEFLEEKEDQVEHNYQIKSAQQPKESSTKAEAESTMKQTPIDTQIPEVSPDISFSMWLKQFNTDQISIDIQDLSQNEKNTVNYKYELVDGVWKQVKSKNKKKGELNAIKEKALQSVKLQNNIATETLAEILLTQGHFQQAIEIYQKLILENPDKNTFFASKINEINEILNKEL